MVTTRGKQPAAAAQAVTVRKIATDEPETIPGKYSCSQFVLCRRSVHMNAFAIRLMRSLPYNHSPRRSFPSKNLLLTLIADSKPSVIT